MKKTALFLLSLSALFWVSCGGGGGGGGGGTPAAVTISISPTSATVEVGGTAQFTATVQNASTTAVTWRVNDVDGGNATWGTISATGLYTAPASVPSPADVAVKAIAQADASKTATATVTIKLHITVAPTTATVPTGGTQQFTATVTGVANTGVNWKVNGVAGGDASVGTISATGLYTAPSAMPAGGTVTVAAVAQADTSKSASATVTIVLAVTISISPTSATVDVGGTVQFAATVQNATDQSVTWKVNDKEGGDPTVGTISTAGLYTAPASVPTPADVTVKAIAQADTSKTATATVTIKLHITVAPTTATVPAGGTQQFAATVTGVANTAVNWKVNGVAGGNASVGTISATGLYTAPSAMPAGGTVTVAAVAQADTSKSASATVTIVFSNALLSGQYAFSFIGWESYSDFFVIAGSFVADGNGTISSGLADLSNYSDVYPALTLTGTYSTNADGRVKILLTDSESNSYTLHAVMVSSEHLRMIQFDSSAAGQGVIDKQDPASFANAAFTGGYAFRLDGYGFEEYWAGFAGRMTADGNGNLTDGVMDVNEGGTDSNAVVIDSGYYDIDPATGRGTATLNTDLGDMNFAFYMVSASKAYFVSLDYFPWTLGAAEKQTLGTFSSDNLTGNYAFFVTGFSTTGTYFNAGRFTANGSGGTASAGVSDENNAGVTEENLALTGTYSVAANGRGTASFTSNRGTSVMSFYLVSPSRALFVQQGAYVVATGEVDAQSGTFTTGSLAGDYGMSLDGDPSWIVGQFNATGGGAASGTVNVNTWDTDASTFVPEADQAFTATYSVTANGRGDFTVAGSPATTLHIYMISGSKVIIIGMSEMLLGAAEKQF